MPESIDIDSIVLLPTPGFGDSWSVPNLPVIVSDTIPIGLLYVIDQNHNPYIVHRDRVTLVK